MEKVALNFSGASLLVFWGQTFRLTDGVIVETQLSIPKLDSEESRDLQTWRVKIADKGSTTDGVAAIKVEVDLPARRVDFAPTKLEDSFVSVYGEDENFKIYDLENRKKVVGNIGHSEKIEVFQSNILFQEKGFFVKKPNENIRGWVRVPRVTELESEALDFVKGVIFVLLEDWKTASALFQRITKDQNAPSDIKFEAFLYTAFVKERAGIRALQEINAALDINRYSAQAAKYLIMSHLGELARLSEKSGQRDAPAHLIADKRAVLAAEIKSALEKYSGNFAGDDPWLETLLKYLP